MDAKRRGYKTVRVKSPDSDVFFLLLYYVQQIDGMEILFDTGTGNKKRLINVTEMAKNMTELHIEALLSLHAFTGCDSTSCFKGVGKLKPMKTLQRLVKYEIPLARLSDRWDVPTDLIDDLDAFICAFYGLPGIRHVDELRFLKLNELSSEDRPNTSRNVDMSSVPPCRKSLEQHIRRVNYQVGIWKHSHIPKPDISAANNGHGWTLAAGKLEPMWYDGEALPQALLDIRQRPMDFSSDDSDSDDDLIINEDENYQSDSDDE